MAARKLLKFVVAVIAGVIVIGLILVAFFLWQISHGVFASAEFDPKLWFANQTAQTDVTCYRGGMAEDIRERLLRPGMPREEVERLLGAPDIGAGSKEYRYILGMCSGFGIDYDDLHLYFDDEGRYLRSAIIQH